MIWANSVPCRTGGRGTQVSKRVHAAENEVHTAGVTGLEAGIRDRQKRVKPGKSACARWPTTLLGLPTLIFETVTAVLTLIMFGGFAR
jgi:hypothetical protein